jgi:D-alanyl-lipoteichoic acid acyltransferase DltB (MBOAT superfamily)
MNLMLTMLLGGLWHGAHWNFVLWGFFHGLLLLIYRHVPWFKMSDANLHTVLQRLPRVLLMFALTMVGWVIFRCHTITQMLDLLHRLDMTWQPGTHAMFMQLLLFVVPMVGAQIIAHRKGDLVWIARSSPIFSSVIMALMLVGLAIFGVRQTTEFIYFQF